MTPLLRKFLGMNWVLVLTTIGLLIFGVFAIYSAGEFRDKASIAEAWRKHIDWALMGLALFFVVSLIDYRWVRWGCPFAYIVGLVGLFLLTLPSFAIENYGQTNWIRIFGVSLQPSQPAIVAGILILAVGIAELPRLLPKVFRFHFLRMAVTGLIAGVPMMIILKEDLGSGMVWAPVLASMWLVGRIPYRYLITLALLGLAVAPVAYYFALGEEQQSRIDTLVRMWQGKKVNMQDEGWDYKNITIAIGSAGWDGKGWLAHKVEDQRSINRMKFIPDTAINDYIFPVIAEEHGFRGSLILISSLLLLLLQCVFVAFYSRDPLGRLLVVGTVAMLFFHIFWNIGMCLMLFPIAGIPIPLISYGGTFLLCVMFLLGLVQSVWVHRNTPLKADPRDQQGGKPA